MVHEVSVETGVCELLCGDCMSTGSTTLNSILVRFKMAE